MPSTPLLFRVHSMRFLVCDDNKMFAENISNLLNDLCSERSIDVTIDSFTDAGMFLNEDLQKYDAVFLDVMMDVPRNSH
ncbi:MAG: response regulator transcription factor [Aeriscardovia sp.]|nr:response regulator transcription factor [Aeriscardovia sp.]